MCENPSKHVHLLKLTLTHIQHYTYTLSLGVNGGLSTFMTIQHLCSEVSNAQRPHKNTDLVPLCVLVKFSNLSCGIVEIRMNFPEQ